MNRAEELTRKETFGCFKCGDNSTPLYCLNCAETLAKAADESLREVDLAAEKAARLKAEAACAEMLSPKVVHKVREALESALAGVWDGHYTGKGVTADYARAVDKEVKEALALLDKGGAR